MFEILSFFLGDSRKGVLHNIIVSMLNYNPVYFAGFFFYVLNDGFMFVPC